jgi:flagellar biogenesis protein FliO
MEEIHSKAFGARGDSWITRLLAGALSAVQSVKFSRREKLLHLRETLPLGEKRLLAVVEFENERFLIGATGQTISLLHKVNSSSQVTAQKIAETATVFEGRP